MSEPLDLEYNTSETLDKNSHDTFEDGHCAMELVAWLADEPFSARPACCSPVLGAFVRSWNDSLSDPPRTELLRPFLPRLVAVCRQPEAGGTAFLHGPGLADPGLHACVARSGPGPGQPRRGAAGPGDDHFVRHLCAGWAALAPTVKSLQASACDLLDRMIAVTEVDGER